MESEACCLGIGKTWAKMKRVGHDRPNLRSERVDGTLILEHGVHILCYREPVKPVVTKRVAAPKVGRAGEFEAERVAGSFGSRRRQPPQARGSIWNLDNDISN